MSARIKPYSGAAPPAVDAPSDGEPPSCALVPYDDASHGRSVAFTTVELSNAPAQGEAAPAEEGAAPVEIDEHAKISVKPRLIRRMSTAIAHHIPPPPNLIALAQDTKRDILNWRPPTKEQIKDGVATFWSSFLSGFRSDHTVISFVSPAEDDEALNDMQVVQLFWAALHIDLWINCVQDGGPSDPLAYSPSNPLNDFVNGFLGAMMTVTIVLCLRAIFRWGNKRKIAEGGGPVALAKKVRDKLLENRDKLAPICGRLYPARLRKAREARRARKAERGATLPAVGKRPMLQRRNTANMCSELIEADEFVQSSTELRILRNLNAAATAPMAPVCKRATRFAAVRRVAGRVSLTAKSVQLRRRSSAVRASAPAPAVASTVAASGGTAARFSRARLFMHRGSMFSATVAPSAASTAAAAPAFTPPAAGGGAAVRFARARRVVRHAMLGTPSSPPASPPEASSPPASPPEASSPPDLSGGGAPASADTTTATKVNLRRASLMGVLQNARSACAHGAPIIPVGAPADAPATATAAPSPNTWQKLLYVDVNWGLAKQAVEAEQAGGGGEVTQEQIVRARTRLRVRQRKRRAPSVLALKWKEVQLRSPRIYYARSAFAWCAVWTVQAYLAFTIVVYAALMGPDQTNVVILGWFMSLGIAFVAIEPFNIFMVALLPVILSEDGCCMKCYNNVFFFYSEYLA